MFKAFLESLRTPDNQDIINSILEGYDTLVEDIIPITKVKGTFYHGTAVSKGEKPPQYLDMVSDYEAIWITEEPQIAELFADWKGDGGLVDKYIYTVEVNTDKIADLTQEHIYKEFKDMLGFEDLRDSIDWLKKQGLKGWITTGSIDVHPYQDIAIFYPQLINIKSIDIVEG